MTLRRDLSSLRLECSQKTSCKYGSDKGLGSAVVDVWGRWNSGETFCQIVSHGLDIQKADAAFLFELASLFISSMCCLCMMSYNLSRTVAILEELENTLHTNDKLGSA